MWITQTVRFLLASLGFSCVAVAFLARDAVGSVGAAGPDLLATVGPALAAPVATDLQPAIERVWLALGQLHPLVVHFPIALIVVAGVVEFCRVRRGVDRPSTTAFVCLWLGAIGAVVAAAMGWSSAITAGYGGSVAWILDTHRWLGVATAVFGVFAAMVATISRVWTDIRLLNAYRVATVFAALLVGVTGHFGGSLVHGETHVQDAIAMALGRDADGGASNAKSGGVTLASVPSGAVDYHRDIEPILMKRCYQCHTGEKPEGGYSLATRDSMLKGGKSGKPAIVPGSSAESYLFQLVSGHDSRKQMPPKGGALSGEQISAIGAWIDSGASMDGSLKPGEHWHWAYRAPVRANPPTVKDTYWPRGAIDHFTLSKMESEGLKPSPEADRATLIRRLSLDLIGLPPSVSEVDAFVKDRSADAYERVVDRLLSSPHYGERWARVWLDLARYADSHGYEKDGLRVMWPYRDWVIRSFNEDMPYDVFTVEQLAGDLLPGASPRQLIATGFHRNTQTNEEGGTDVEEFRVDAVIDRVNTTGSVWLGSTWGCAQCHDHKNDPLTQKEYYQLLAVFNQDGIDVHVHSTTEKQAAGAMVDVALDDRYEELESVKRRVGELEALVARGATEAEGEAAAKDAARDPAHASAVKELETLKSRLSELIVARALVLARNETPRVTRVFNGGNFLSPGEAVEAKTPAFLPPMPAGVAVDRLSLSRWIASPENPLTARVAVNRLWETVFGRGIVETSEDFGPQGDAPTHPELLDWLATELVRNGWSLKRTLREIVTSATYRQSSRVTPQLLEKDPLNRLLARSPRYRVEAETIRDVALGASGMLTRTIGGPSVFPPQPAGTWTQIYSGDQWTESNGADRYRRGLYTFWRRTSPYPAFTGFDAPSREISCSRRVRTNTPLQALTTLNDPAFMELAAGLARRMMTEGGSTSASRAAYGMRLCVSRQPSKAEIDRLVALYERELERYEGDGTRAGELASWGAAGAGGEFDTAEVSAWTIVANVLLNLDETVTRE